MRKILLLILSLFVFAVLAGCSTQSANLQGKLLDANSSYCRMLWQQGSNLQTSSYNEGTFDVSQLSNFPDSPKSVVDPAIYKTNQLQLRDSHNSLCETKAAYNKRTKLDLEI